VGFGIARPNIIDWQAESDALLERITGDLPPTS
jgi:hypothetical protein